MLFLLKALEKTIVHARGSVQYVSIGGKTGIPLPLQLADDRPEAVLNQGTESGLVKIIYQSV
jgi:hypothetical protein